MKGFGKMSVITIDSLRKVTRVVYHSNCADGLSSALICKAALEFIDNVDVEYVPITYGIDLESLDIRPGTLFVDMCPAKINADKWVEVNPIVLDHHESAKPIVAKFVNGIFGDSNYSGAMLAFEHVLSTVRNELHITKEIFDTWQNFATLCMIYDTWKSTHKDWLPACRLTTGLITLGIEKLFKLLSNEKTNSVYEIRKVLDEAIQIGTPIFDDKLKQSEYYANNCLKFQVGHLNCAFINVLGAPVSLTGNALIERHDVDVAIFGCVAPSKRPAKDGLTIMEWGLSFRSSNRFNVSRLGGLLGGGGHAKAGGGSYAGTSTNQLSNITIQSASVGDLLSVVERCILSIVNEV